MEQEKIKTVIMRGGTSKAIFLKSVDLPEDQEMRDKMILRVFGSPDVRQIDGLGGADPLTSKLAIICPPTRPDADVDYTFGQVSYTVPKIDYSGNCGNVSSAVGPFAVDEGYVAVKKPHTTVRVHNTNTGKILTATVPVVGGKAKVSGHFSIDGVPGTGAEIAIDFSDTAGAKTGKLLPTGNVVDKINVSGYGEVAVSIVDAANPMIFVKAESLRLTGTEMPDEIDSDPAILAVLEEIRGKAAVILAMAGIWEEAKVKTPAFPMIAFVSPAKDYTAFNKDAKIPAGSIDFISRLMFMQIMHKTYAGTGIICTGVAAKIEGTIVNEVMLEKGKGKSSVISIGHPAGVAKVDLLLSKKGDLFILKRATISRTARRIMDGYCYIPRES